MAAPIRAEDSPNEGLLELLVGADDEAITRWGLVEIVFALIVGAQDSRA
jgi:hypothetical protein